ncbi:MAG: N-acetylmuramoyl-L-alanine amidase [Clostridia bacterium]|nr:N-acetylmuramoyl-L-alanine amidase [Clostridia bacterium]
MIRRKQSLSRLMKTVLALLLLCQTVSCGGEEEAEETTTEPSAPTIAVTPAVPGVGIGRVMPVAEEPNGIIVCIDAGHGFMDGGTGDGVLPDGLLEKDITMMIAQKLSEDLTMYGYTTLLTHDGETLPPAAVQDHIFNAYERADYANSIDMDYFISIHVNSAQNTEAEGSRIYYYDSSNKVKKIGGEVAERMGKAIEKNLPDDLDPVIVDQSTDPYNAFILCNQVNAPSSLVEIGFCTNPNDAGKMVRDDWQEQFAQSLADGINEYFKEYAE